jgi:hypothetical protein
VDQVEPVLTVDADVIRRVCDRPVLGLLGQKVMRDRAVWIDYREQVVALIPVAPSTELQDLPLDGANKRAAGRGDGADPSAAQARNAATLRRSRDVLAGVLTSRAVGVPFTLVGAAEARIARLPAIELEAEGGPLHLEGVDAGVITSELGQILSRVTHETIHGLIGYSFLKHFRVVVDYPDGVLWLDPIPGYRDDRPLEYCHVGLQLERQEGAVIVTGVAADSPADRAGIARGDEVVAMDGDPARALDLITLTRRMEGEPGHSLTLVMRRGSVDHTYKLVRRRLL